MDFVTLSDDSFLSSCVSEEDAHDDDVAVAATASNSYTRNQQHEVQQLHNQRNRSATKKAEER